MGAKCNGRRCASLQPRWRCSHNAAAAERLYIWMYAHPYIEASASIYGCMRIYI